MGHGIALILPLAAELSAGSKSAPPLPVSDFALFDHTGEFHRLYYFDQDPQTKAIVLFVQGNGCPLVRKRAPVLGRLQSVYEPKGVRFYMINVNPQDERDEIAEEARAFALRMPILIDDTQWVGRDLKLNRTAEALVVDPQDWRVRYRGAIDNQLDYETAKPEASRDYLAEALDAVLAGEPVALPRTDSPGCRITYLEPPAILDDAYAEVIAPLVIDHCTRCHRSGGIAPFAFSSHRKLRGWSEMIREVLMTRRMPPWQADPHSGVFSNDFSLSREEREALLHWVDAGAAGPREPGEDPLRALPAASATWALGTPDYTLRVPDQAVPAEGLIDYRYLRFDSPFDRDVWIQGVEVRPGSVEVLHHLIVYALTFRGGEEQRRWLAGYAPGSEAEAFPEGSAMRLRQTDTLLLELHYTASGRPVVDRSEVGLYVAPESSYVPLRTGIFIDPEIRIPPQARAHRHHQEQPVKRDIVLFSLFPHMHFRGKSMRFTVRYPNTTSEVLLSVPQYDFNWQRAYWLAEPKRIPAGSVLRLDAAWDNSGLNKANPDPTRAVTWGEQSFDEMFFGTYRFVEAQAWDTQARFGHPTLPGSKRSPTVEVGPE